MNEHISTIPVSFYPVMLALLEMFSHVKCNCGLSETFGDVLQNPVDRLRNDVATDIAITEAIKPSMGECFGSEAYSRTELN
jgi:hypothetical protein